MELWLTHPSIPTLGAEIMKHRMDLRTKMNHTAHDANLSHIKQHVAKLKAFHAGCKDYNFGTARK